MDITYFNILSKYYVRIVGNDLYCIENKMILIFELYPLHRSLKFANFPEFFEKVTALKKDGVKVLIAIGGWTDSKGGKYSEMVGYWSNN